MKNVCHGIVLPVVDEVGEAGVTVGIVGSVGAELPTLPVMGATVVVGTGVAGLTPRLPIS